MKNIIAIIIFIMFCGKAIAEERWDIEGSGSDVQTKPKYDYDYSRRYKGEIEKDGYIRMRNPYTGDVMRGYIEKDGYGKLRDSEGNIYKVRPD